MEWLIVNALWGAVIVLSWWVLHSVYWDVKNGWRLPPGSMGFPLIGESLHMLWKPGTTLKPSAFFDNRKARYGELFKTHLFGEPVVVSTSAMINAVVLQKEGALFQSAYPSKFAALIGNRSLMEAPSRLHMRVRGLVTRVTGPSSLPQCVHEIEESLVKRLASWESSRLVYMNKEACEMAFDLAVRRILSLTLEDGDAKDLLHNFSDFNDGLIALPINLTGTTYNKCIKGRAKMVDIFENLILKRTNAGSDESQPTQKPKDLLDLLLEEERKDSVMHTRKSTIDLMVNVMYAAFETTAAALTFLVKFITEHQDILHKLMEEHLAIREKKGRCSKGLTWEDFKSMSYTRDVIHETLRLANVAPFLYRQALVDVEIEGYLIPKGWKIITCLSSMHLDSTNFNDPLSFNPSRWKDIPAMGNKSCFMGYGGGPRVCAGSELSILEISIFLHHFVTKYSWRAVGEEQIIRCPGVKFKNGYPIEVNRRD